MIHLHLRFKLVKGNFWYEPNYEGYGEFGGMDYYELLDKMNGGKGDRARGIDLAFGHEKVASKVLFPALTVSPTLSPNHDFTKEAESDPNQSWYVYPEYDEEDEFYRGDDDYDGGEEELDEAKIEEKYNTFSHKIAEKFAEYMSKKEGRNFTVTPNSVDEYSFDLDDQLWGDSYPIIFTIGTIQTFKDGIWNQFIKSSLIQIGNRLV